EPWLRGGRIHPAGQCARHPSFPVRRDQPGHRTDRCARVLVPGTPRSIAGAVRRSAAVRPVHLRARGARVIRRLCALLLALAAGWACPVAAAGTGADMLSEAEIARLAELGFDALPLTAVVEMVSAREPAWPFEANPDAV